MKIGRYLVIVSLSFLTVISLYAIFFMGKIGPFRPITADFIKREMMFSVKRLFIEEKNGQGLATCTTFAYDKNGYNYKFATAGHCFLPDNLEEQKSQFLPPEAFIAEEFDKDGNPIPIYPVILAGVTKNHYMADFAVLEVKLDKDIPVLKLSEDDPFLGECVFLVGFPSDADDNIFFGYVEVIFLDEGRVSFEVKGMKDSGGTSGAPLFDCYTRKVVGIVVSGLIMDTNKLSAIPISRFKKFTERSERMRISRPDGY